jgi:hypothetical protein
LTPHLLISSRCSLPTCLAIYPTTHASGNTPYSLTYPPTQCISTWPLTRPSHYHWPTKYISTWLPKHISTYPPTSPHLITIGPCIVYLLGLLSTYLLGRHNHDHLSAYLLGLLSTYLLGLLSTYLLGLQITYTWASEYISIWPTKFISTCSWSLPYGCSASHRNCRVEFEVQFYPCIDAAIV